MEAIETTSTTTTTVAASPIAVPPLALSKNQLKKQKKYAEFAEQRKLRRVKERERQKQKRQLAKEKGLPVRTGPSRKELKRRQLNSDAAAATASSPSSALSVAIDLDYDELMHSRDIAKCVKQCLRIYTINRRSEQPCRLHFTGIKRDGHIHETFKKNDGWENWHVDYHFDETHTQLFEHSKLVYLTCESDTVLQQLRPDCTYVIGGLVDHNHHKGLCHKRAVEAGLATARLPLSECVDMKTRAVLSTFHVFELLTRVAAGQDWTQAILDTIPMRKGAKPKLMEVEHVDEDKLVEDLAAEADS